METRLVDSSIFNIPFNLFQDIVNIPYNEIQALNTLANSGFSPGTGLWSARRTFGEWTPGTPRISCQLPTYLLPFPELSGLGQPETDFNAGLGQQLWGLVAAELPMSGVRRHGLLTQVPTSPITGITSIDSFIWDSRN